MLLQICYQDGTHEYRKVDECKLCVADQWIAYSKNGGAGIEICGDGWSEVRAIYINNRLAYIRPADRYTAEVPHES